MRISKNLLAHVQKLFGASPKIISAVSINSGTVSKNMYSVRFLHEIHSNNANFSKIGWYFQKSRLVICIYYPIDKDIYLCIKFFHKYNKIINF